MAATSTAPDTNGKPERTRPTMPCLLMALTGLFCIGASATLFAITGHPEVPAPIKWALGLQALLLAVTGGCAFAAGVGVLAASGVLSIPGLRRRASQ